MIAILSHSLFNSSMRNLWNKALPIFVLAVVVYPQSAWALLGGGGEVENTGGGGSGLAIVSDALSTESVCLAIVLLVAGYWLYRRYFTRAATSQHLE